jgi:polar amino acid transport system substrate-binding protein
MRSKVTSLVGGSLVVWAAALAFSATGPAQASAPQATSNDGIYTKAQADGASKQFAKICADCHPFTVAAKKKPKDLPLGDEPFFEQCTGRPLTELVTLIALTMPNDGSAVVTEAEAVDLVAYILQQNGFPAGSKPLTKEAAAAVLARPKK